MGKPEECGSSMLCVNGLHKQYGSFTAVDGISFEVAKGQCFGLLGPNGAGKTSTINVISTLALPTAGSVILDGVPLERNRYDLKKKLGLITQEYSMRKELTVDEIMSLHGRLYGLPRAERRDRTERLLAFCGLTEQRKKQVKYLSGGMKRRLMLCRAMLTDPSLLLLDEPTVGLDPMSRRQVWDLVRNMKERGTAVLLTTHYMEEAQALCDQAAFLKDGRIHARGSPSALIAALGQFTVEETVHGYGTRHYFASREDAQAFAARLRGNYEIREIGLEDVYFEIINGNTSWVSYMQSGKNG